MQKMIKQNLNQNPNKTKKETQIKKPKNALYNIEMLYKAENKVIEFFDDYSSMIYEAKIKATKGTGLLTPKKMLQRLPIALAQAKAGNNS